MGHYMMLISVIGLEVLMALMPRIYTNLKSKAAEAFITMIGFIGWFLLLLTITIILI